MRDRPSKRQAEVLKFITEFQKDNKYSPSLAEIADFFDVSTSTVHQHVSYLRKKGLLKTEKHKKRAMNIPAKGENTREFKNLALSSFTIPILGVANAGTATAFAEENIEGYLKVSRDVLNRRDGIFSLRVEGDSMNKAKIGGKSIAEGDFVLIDSEYRNPKNGDYVLSIIDGCANLKKFKRDKKTGQITLESESTNTRHKPIYISSEDDYMINGKIISVIKK